MACFLAGKLSYDDAAIPGEIARGAEKSIRTLPRSRRMPIFRDEAIVESAPTMTDQAIKLVRGHVSPSGRLSLPAEFRKALGIERGGNVVIELDGNDIRIRSVREAVAQAQAMSRRLLAGKPGLSVDGFLAHRREDWGEE